MALITKLTRRKFITSVSLLGLTMAQSACTRQTPKGDGAGDKEGSLAWAVKGSWRSPVDKSRDAYRHPIETLSFFGILPDDSLIEMWPGAGYMTQILAPYLARGGGHYRPALFEERDLKDGAAKAMNDTYKAYFGTQPKLYGPIDYTAFGPQTLSLSEAGSVDKILFLLCIQDWMAAGIAEKAFMDAYAALKSGGILCIEQHRADIGNVQDPAASSGYVQEPFVKQLADEAGFKFVESSEINANPKDSKDSPFGVWTLPPQRLTAPRGDAPNPDFDGSLYESIGESDRMTLKFKKP
jgi:predicted methyltransferase